MNSLNGGYAMIKYNSTQEELQIAYRSKKPVLCYDENRRAHWAVIEETATESVDEETQEPITIYEYSYRLIDEASGEKLYQHTIKIAASVDTSSDRVIFLVILSYSNQPKNWQDILSYCENERQITGYARAQGETKPVYWAKKFDNTKLSLYYYTEQSYFLPDGTVIDTITEV